MPGKKKTRVSRFAPEHVAENDDTLVLCAAMVFHILSRNLKDRSYLVWVKRYLLRAQEIGLYHGRTTKVFRKMYQRDKGYIEWNRVNKKESL